MDLNNINLQISEKTTQTELNNINLQISEKTTQMELNNINIQIKNENLKRQKNIKIKFLYFYIFCHYFKIK